MASRSPKWKAFSAAEHLAATNADNAWELPKDRGNEALKQKDYALAAEYYREAALLAMGPLEGGAFHAFISALERYPEGSPQRSVVDNEDLLWRSLLVHSITGMPLMDRTMQLPDGNEMVAKYPNKGAAIAWANRAQALLLDGKPKAALRSAKRATQANPEYLKGHHREMKALEALGKVTAAREIQQEMQEYELARMMYPTEAVALLSSGWITWERASLVYGPVRFRAAADAVRTAGEADENMRIEARASIVPFEGGQLLMLTLVYGLDSEIECMDFRMVDHTNGHLADQPPNGHASASALEHAPIVIGKFMGELQQWDLKPVAVMCGQGLVDHVDYIDEKLKAGCPRGLWEPFDDVLVYASSSTYAGESSGRPPQMNNPAAIEAMMARLLGGV